MAQLGLPACIACLDWGPSASWGAPVVPPPRLPCPSPHISSCWMLDLAVRQPGTGCCFQGDEEELGGGVGAPDGVLLLQGSPSNLGPPL